MSSPLLAAACRILGAEPAIESVVAVSGTLRRRPEGQENIRMSSGSVELVVDQWRLLNDVHEALPIKRNDAQTGEEMRLRHRHMDLRRPEMQSRLLMRSKTGMYVSLPKRTLWTSHRVFLYVFLVFLPIFFPRARFQSAMAARSFLHSNGFCEIELPTLFRSTPEGAREFIVPTRNKFVPCICLLEIYRFFFRISP